MELLSGFILQRLFVKTKNSYHIISIFISAIIHSSIIATAYFYADVKSDYKDDQDEVIVRIVNTRMIYPAATKKPVKQEDIEEELYREQSEVEPRPVKKHEKIQKPIITVDQVKALLANSIEKIKSVASRILDSLPETTSSNEETAKDIAKTDETMMQSSVFVPAEVANNQPPDYPKIAVIRGYEGVVELSVLVSKDGICLDVAVTKSSGHTILDKAAVEAVTKWTFTPAKKDGKDVEDSIKLKIRFKLVDKE